MKINYTIKLLCFTVIIFLINDTLEAQTWKPAQGILMTQWAKDVTPESVLPDYPRPQLVRDAWQNLNGLWDYVVSEKSAEKIPSDYAGKIMVPFPIEAPLSGVMKALLPGQLLWYHREFVIPDKWSGQRVLLHFGAVDWEATIYIDGQKLGSHRGGYDGFSFDITKYIKKGGSHNLVVSVWDASDREWQLHGKQTLRPGGCSYTACTGIWQTVWLEPVPESHIEELVSVPDLDKGILKLTINARTVPQTMKIVAVATDGGKAVASISGNIGEEITPQIRNNLVDFFKATSTWVSTELQIPIKKAKTWSPDSPFLYGLTVYLKDADNKVLDSVTSYFGMRSVKVGRDTQGNNRLLLNGKPIMMPGALDQGYWPDGVYVAPTDEALKFDIEFAKKVGLNTLRKHVKVEPQRWYYWADKFGVLIFQDMPTGNCGDPRTDMPSSPVAADQWKSEIEHIIDEKFSHPSIVVWDLFNEAFGGFDYIRNVKWIEQKDPSRLVNESSGFPWHGGGKVRDGHGGLNYKDPNGIGIISEWGTASLGCAGHQWPHSWSYGSYDPKTGKEMDFLAYYNKNKETAVLPDITPEAGIWLTNKVSDFFVRFLSNTAKTGLSGQFYCQLTDVETECNGLISFDRAVTKIDPSKVADAIRANTPKLKPE